MFGLFAYLRSRITAAILGGVQDALDALEETPVPGETPALIERLRARLTGPTEERAEVDQDGEPADVAPTATNGTGRKRR